MRKSHMLVYILMLLGAIGAFVLGIVALIAKANVGVLGINVGIIDILAGFMALVFLLIIYTVLREEK